MLLILVVYFMQDASVIFSQSLVLYDCIPLWIIHNTSIFTSVKGKPVENLKLQIFLGSFTIIEHIGLVGYFEIWKENHGTN